MARVKVRGGGGEVRKETNLPSFPPSPPPPTFLGSRFISRAGKTENPVPPSFFAQKPNGNACYAGYGTQNNDVPSSPSKRPTICDTTTGALAK